MKPAPQLFQLPKRGNSAEEYEDACAWTAEQIAIADGATESSFSDLWARSLVDKFVSQPPAWKGGRVPLEEWLKPLQAGWQKAVPWDRLPWYAEEKARGGAFASFVGVEFKLGRKGRGGIAGWFSGKKKIEWHGIALGDSCIFQIRKDELIKSFPMERAADFNNRPRLISSLPDRNKSLAENLRTISSHCREGDFFLAMTDAIGQWFLAEKEAGRRPWNDLGQLKSSAEFASLIDRCRDAGTMRNDDTTLLLYPSPPEEPRT